MNIRAAEMARRSFHYIAIGLLAAYLVLAYAVRELGIEKYEKPFLGSTLLLLLLAALAHAAGMSETQKGVERVEETLKSVTEQLSSLSREDSKVTFHEGKTKVYQATVSAILASSKRVWVTHFRNDGPMRGGAADRHFAECREWARRHGGFRRIVLGGDNERLQDFTGREVAFAAEVNADDPHRYLLRALNGTKHLTEAFNVGIYDDLVIFTHRDGDQAIGFSVQDDKMLNYIVRYYERLWNQADPIA